MSSMNQNNEENPIKSYLMLQKLVADPSKLHALGTVDPAFPVYERDNDDDEDEEDEDDEEEKRKKDKKNEHFAQLRSSLQTLSRDTPFAIGGAMRLSRHDNMCVLLKVGQDEVKSLLADVDYDKVASLCVPSAFGNVTTGETLMDTKVRIGLELDAEGREDVVTPSPHQVSLVIEYPAQVVANPEKDWPGFVHQAKEWIKHGYTYGFDIHSFICKELADKIESCAELAELTASSSSSYYKSEVYVRRKDTSQSGTKYNQPEFLGRILHHLQKSLLPDMKFTLEPYKLMMYETGGHFKPHKDSPVKDMVATLLVALPSEHTGGVLEVRENHGQSMAFDFSSKSGDKQSIQWCAFFSDCEHVLRPVESGRRVVLAYRILARPSAARAVSAYPFEEDFQFSPLAVDVKSTALEKVVPNVYCSTGFVLRHEYGLLSLQPDLLKGMDRVLYERLKQACKPQAQPRLYSILVREEAQQDEHFCYPKMINRRGVVYAVSLPEVRFQAELSTNRPPPPVDKDVTFVRGNWVEGDVALLENEVESVEHMGNEARVGEYAYVYLQSAIVITQEDLK
ncbi:hypothetical protein BASA81_007375 [Batrachochytrium salamandrivorans]|nr:hypothetical protein BASA81_007375 [Batrachochytrium salamandrivorans]